MRNIIIRADSSSKIGIGHIMRDLVLAKQYKNSNIIFATQDLDGNINNKILKSGYKLEILDSNDFKELDKLIKKHSADIIIIDNYEIDYKFEKKLKFENKKLTILAVDDTYEKHYCDILLNHNISAKKKRYKELVPAFCQLRCGSKYTLLRDEFIQEKQKKSIFIAMGGADHSQINIKILEVLKHFNKLEINIVTTLANENLEKLQEYTKNKNWINLHINSNQIAKLMKQSDCAIITPSVTLNEIHYMQVPFIAIKTAKNQDDIYKYLKQNGYRTLKKFKYIKLENALNSMLDEIK